MKHTPEEIKYRLSNIGEAIGNIALDYITDLEKENAELKKQVEKHKWNDIFLEDCAVYGNKIAEEYTSLQEQILKLEKENAELKEKLKNQKADYETYYKSCYNAQKKAEKQLTKAKEIIQSFLQWANDDVGSPKFQNIVDKAEQFLKGETETVQEEPYYVIVNMNCQYEICRKCPKSGLFKGTYEECEKWIKEKLRKAEK